MSAPPRFRLGLVQMRCATDAEANLHTATAGIREAAARGARLVCLPELFRTRYFCQAEDAAAFDTAVGRVAALVCWDQWYPEGARLAALAGANVLLYPTAIGWHPSEKAEHGETQLAAWQTVQRAHAIANGVYVAAVNRVGHEGAADGGLEVWGASVVCDPFGVVLAEASRAAEEG